MRLIKILFIFIACILSGAGLAQAQFDPANPSEPSMKYRIALSSDPANIAWFSGNGFYTDGTTVWINASAHNANYQFSHWTKDGVVYTQNQSFSYTINTKDAKFVAHYRYCPDNPADPSLVLRSALNIKAQPEGASSFNMTSGERLVAGQSYYICAYGNAQYEFLGWYNDTVKISDMPYFTYTMPTKAVTLTARYKFNPSAPPDPSNFYSTSCELDVKASDTIKGTVAVSGLTNGRAVYGTKITVTATPMEGYEFYGWYDGGEKLSLDAIYSFTATSAYIGKTLTALFLHNPHTLTYMVDGEVYATEMLEAGSPITVLDQPTKDGYTFSGWGEVPATMPVKDLTVAGTFSLSSIRIIPSPLTLAGGERVRLKAYAGSTSMTEVTDVLWSVEDGTVASIRSTGMVRGLRTGTTKVTAVTTKSSSVKATCDITVSSDYTMVGLPDVDFEFNFNAHNYDAVNKRIPNNFRAELRDCFLQLQGNAPAFVDGERLSINSVCKGFIDKWAMDETASGAHFRRVGTDSMTIICKVAPRMNTGNSCDFIVNRNGGYNYMFRIGDNNSMYLHTGTGYQSVRALALASEEEQVLAVRVDGAAGTIRLDNLSTGESKTVTGVNYGGGTNTLMKFFYNSDDEYFTGDFYWCYLSFGYLNDKELNAVVDYNEDVTIDTELEYVNGDANASGAVNVTDITAVVSYIYGQTPDPFCYEAADVNNSGTINVADISGIISIIYGVDETGNGANTSVRCTAIGTTNQVCVNPLSASAGEETEMQIGISNPWTEFSAYEMNLIMPEGIEVISSDLSLARTDTRNFNGAYVNGKYKLMAFSMDNEPFTGTSGTVATVRLKVDGDIPSGIYEIQVRNAVISNRGDETTLPDCSAYITVGDCTGIGGVTTGENVVGMYDLTGRRIGQGAVLDGVYIVRTKDNSGHVKSQKILIRQ